ncbi:unnamed protein product [Sympodiomycopsis kandeliae]
MTSASNPPSYTETKLRIPFPNSSKAELEIVGILSHSTSSPTPSATPKPLALILHGVLSHKNQSYHKLLSSSLPIDSFRFDFRANHETPGEWNMAKFDNDIQDINCVLAYLEQHYNYNLQLLVGHSRGSLVGWKFLSQYPSPQNILWVSLGGRWRMNRIHDRDHLYNPQFESNGYYTWNVKVAGQDVSVQITPEQVEEFAQFPIDQIVSRFPKDIDCLLLHGTKDETVPCADVAYYLNALISRSDRNPGQTQIHLVEDANHMFKGHYEEVAGVITQWYRSRNPSQVVGPSSAREPAQMALEASQEADVFENSWQDSNKGKL